MGDSSTDQAELRRDIENYLSDAVLRVLPAAAKQELLSWARHHAAELVPALSEASQQPEVSQGYYLWKGNQDNLEATTAAHRLEQRIASLEQASRHQKTQQRISLKDVCKRSDRLYVGMRRAVPVVDSFSRRTARLQAEIRRQTKASEIIARSVTSMGDALRRQSKDLQKPPPNIQEVIKHECAGIKEATHLDIQEAIQAKATEIKESVADEVRQVVKEAIKETQPQGHDYQVTLTQLRDIIQKLQDAEISPNRNGQGQAEPNQHPQNFADSLSQIASNVATLMNMIRSQQTTIQQQRDVILANSAMIQTLWVKLHYMS